MDEGFIVATQLSSLQASQPISVTIQTTRQHVPLPPNPAESDPPPEHATYSYTLNTPTSGSILLRLIHGGLIIELISLTSQAPAIRLVFPAVVLKSPALLLWDTSELHVIAVTGIGSLYRVVIPVDNLRLWQGQTEQIWCREYLIKNFPEDGLVGPIHPHGTHCVAISLFGGSLLRLDAEAVGYDGVNEIWIESLFQHGSFLSSLTAFLPTLSSGTHEGSDIINIATHSWPTDVGDIWSLSRDRTLRYWKAKIGCVASKSLALPLASRDSPAPGSSGSGSKHHLLDREQQSLIRIFSLPSREEHLYVIIFLPTPSSSTSAGAFRLVDTWGDQLYEIGKVDCSKYLGHRHLQDFVLVGETIYVLWNCQGRSMIEKIGFSFEALANNEVRTVQWQLASYIPEPELTPTYMEEQLLSSGSLTEKFYHIIMKPGVFSSYTLRTALEQYTDACISLPGSPPPQLTTTYATLGENIAAVVGCTVTLNRDPHTGALQYANYWTALKRDWEGFVARCREMERSARWPLALGLHGKDDVMVVERERIGLLVKQDTPIFLRQRINNNQSVDPRFDLLSILWTLRTKLGPQMMANLENRVIDILHQEIAFSFADILQDQACRTQFRESLDEGLVSWLIGRLRSIGDLDAAIRTTLDVIGGFDNLIKQEDEDAMINAATRHSPFSLGITETYVTTTIQARYDICLSVISLLFLLSDELHSWDPSLLSEIFAVFRGVAMLRYVAEQSVGSSNTQTQSGSLSADDVATSMRNMTVSHTKSLNSPNYSLLYILLSQTSDNPGFPLSAERFLDSTGLLQSFSPTYATKYEVLFVERLRLLGFCNAAWDLLVSLPRTPGVTYVLSQIFLHIGRYDDASELLEILAGNFGSDSFMTTDDSEALKSILPGAQLFDSQFSFYVYASNIFKNALLVHHEVLFARLATSVAPPDFNTSALWLSIIKGYMDLGLYRDAYASIMSTPYDTQKAESASQLAIRMCEDNAVEILMTFDFAGIATEVEAALSFKARNINPRIHPNYSKVLYSWYMQKGDYRNASLTMFQHARKIQDTYIDTSSFLSIGLLQISALSVAINALSLVDEKAAWVLTPAYLGITRRKLKLPKHIPDARYTSGKSDVEIVHLADMQYEYAYLNAQLDNLKRHPAPPYSLDFMIPPESIILRQAQANLFNQAMATARSLDVDMSDLFTHLTRQCLRLSWNPDAVIQEDTSDWLLTDQVSSWQGTPADKGWRYLRQALERHDSAETDYRYSKATLETILSVDRPSSPPPWLVHILEKFHHEYLIRVSLRFDNIDAAIEYTLSLIRKSDIKLAREPTKTASSTWLPYNLLDQVLVAGSSQDKPPSRLLELRSEITNRVNRVQRYSQALH